jgi:hypothetical protein
MYLYVVHIAAWASLPFHAYGEKSTKNVLNFPLVEVVCVCGRGGGGPIFG